MNRCAAAPDAVLQNKMKVIVYSKDFRVTHFSFTQEGSAAKVAELLRLKAFPENPTEMFAFWHKEMIPQGQNGWLVYDATRELRRLGVPNEQWRITLVNSTYELVRAQPCMRSEVKSNA